MADWFDEEDIEPKVAPAGSLLGGLAEGVRGFIQENLEARQKQRKEMDTALAQFIGEEKRPLSTEAIGTLVSDVIATSPIGLLTKSQVFTKITEKFKYLTTEEINAIGKFIKKLPKDIYKPLEEVGTMAEFAEQMKRVPKESLPWWAEEYTERYAPAGLYAGRRKGLPEEVKQGIYMKEKPLSGIPFLDIWAHETGHAFEHTDPILEKLIAKAEQTVYVPHIDYPDWGEVAADLVSHKLTGRVRSSYTNREIAETKGHVQKIFPELTDYIEQLGKPIKKVGTYAERKVAETLKKILGE